MQNLYNILHIVYRYCSNHEPWHVLIRFRGIRGTKWIKTNPLGIRKVVATRPAVVMVCVLHVTDCCQVMNERPERRVAGRMYTRSTYTALSIRLISWQWRRWHSADLLWFWQAAFSGAAKSPFHTCQAVLCFWGIPSIFPPSSSMALILCGISVPTTHLSTHSDQQETLRTVWESKCSPKFVWS